MASPWRRLLISRSRSRISRSTPANASSVSSPHLCFEKLVAQHRVVVQLGLDGGRDLVEHEPEPAHEKGIE
jgi:hypothetical protein